MSRLLIVDDDVDLCNLLRDALSEHQVFCAYCVQTAEQVYPLFKPDIVLCDFNMPNGTTEPLLEYLKQREVPVILMSCGYREDTHHLQTRGLYTTYLPKPFHLKQLTDTIKEAQTK